MRQERGQGGLPPRTHNMYYKISTSTSRRTPPAIQSFAGGGFACTRRLVTVVGQRAQQELVHAKVSSSLSPHLHRRACAGRHVHREIGEQNRSQRKAATSKKRATTCTTGVGCRGQHGLKTLLPGGEGEDAAQRRLTTAAGTEARHACGARGGRCLCHGTAAGPRVKR